MTGKHDPNEAIRLMENEPVAQSDYKTDDKNWINPNMVARDRALHIKFVKMTETAKIPCASRVGDIGFDICCDEEFVMTNNMTRKVSTGIRLADMPTMDNDRNRIFLKIEGRSGLASSGIFPIGGIVDPTYRGEIGVVLTMNAHSSDFHTFRKGDRIAQLVVYKIGTAGEVVMEETDKVVETSRGTAGFGSSGR